MNYKTLLSYGTRSLDFNKINNDVLHNFFADVRRLEIELLDISPVKVRDIHEYEKHIGNILKNDEDFKNNFKIITEIYFDDAMSTRDSVIKSITRSLQALNVENIEIIKIDFSNVSIDFEQLTKTLSELREQHLFNEIALYNVDLNRYSIVNEFFKNKNLKVNYLMYQLPITKYYDFLINNFNYLKLLDVTLILDDVFKKTDDYKLLVNDELAQLISETGYSSFEFFNLFLNTLNLNKIINISTNKMKMYSRVSKLQDKTLTEKQFNEFVSAIKDIYENH